MLIRLGKLVLLSALCVLAPASAHGAGEFEAFVKRLFLRTLEQSVGTSSSETEVAHRAANCFAKDVVADFTPEEVSRLDASLSDGPSPADDLAGRVLKRLTDPEVGKTYDRTNN